MKTWHKVAIVIIVIVGVFLCVKSCIDKKDADLTVAYIGHDFVQRETFEQNMHEYASLCTDITGDGEIYIDMMEISFNEDLPEGDKQSAWSKLTSAVGAGIARLYFIEESYIRSNADEGFFADISHLGNGITNSKGQVVAISLKDNERVKLFGIEPKEDLYLAVRIVSEMDISTDKNIEAKNSSAHKIAQYIITG